MDLDAQAPATAPPTPLPLDLPNAPVMVTDDFNFATGQPGFLGSPAFDQCVDLIFFHHNSRETDTKHDIAESTQRLTRHASHPDHPLERTLP